MKVDPESGTSQIISQGCQRYMSHHSIEIFDDLRMSNLFCDAVLWLEDVGIFPVHRLILSACSAYFIALSTTPLHCIKRTDVLLPTVTVREFQVTAKGSSSCEDLTCDWKTLIMCNTWSDLKR
jgi:hypothetical protein